MGKKSELIRGTSKCARFFVCDTTQVVKEAQNIHRLDAIATVNFGKLLTAAAIISGDNITEASINHAKEIMGLWDKKVLV